MEVCRRIHLQHLHPTLTLHPTLPLQPANLSPPLAVQRWAPVLLRQPQWHQVGCIANKDTSLLVSESVTTCTVICLHQLCPPQEDWEGVKSLQNSLPPPMNFLLQWSRWAHHQRRYQVRNSYCILHYIRIFIAWWSQTYIIASYHG